MSKNKQRSDELKVKILTFIGRFGWLRINEVARIVWPMADEKNGFKYADLHLRRLEEDGYLQLEKLPERAGTAATLQRKAISFLKKEGIEVTKVSFNPWQERSEWKHDLLTTSLFALLINDTRLCPVNAKYLTDRECKRVRKECTNEILLFNGETKVPDLIIDTIHWGVLAVEVERSTKTGKKNKAPLVKNLILTNTQHSPYMYGDLTPKFVALAFDMQQTVSRNGKIHRVDHEKNIFNTVFRQLSLFGVEKIRLIALKMVVKKYTVSYLMIEDCERNQHEILEYFNTSDGSDFDPTL